MDLQPELPLPPPPLKDGQPYVPARMVNEFQYCPRLASNKRSISLRNERQISGTGACVGVPFFTSTGVLAIVVLL